jgi:hypothetical protein
MLEDYFVEEEGGTTAEVAITNNGQRNQPTILPCVLFAAKERAQCTSAPDVTWTCAWYLVLRNTKVNL